MDMAKRRSFSQCQKHESIAFIHSRMTAILPDDMENDWLNLRYDAMDVMRAAVTEVLHRAV